MGEHGVRALADALVQERQWRQAVPELRDYHSRRLTALSKALGAAGTVDPLSGLDGLLDATVRRLASSASPFEDFLEAPKPVADFYRRHGQAIGTAAAGLRAALTALLVDLVVAVHAVAPDRVVTDEDLRRHGFDPRTPEPDPLDFW